MTDSENAHDKDKLTMQEYREIYGEPSPLEKAIAREEGRELDDGSNSESTKKNPTPEEKIKRTLADLSEEEQLEIISELFGD